MKTKTVTSKGQITLPIDWRRKAGNPEKVEIIDNDGILEIHPVEREENWVTIFDAEKDGGPMSPDELIGIIQSIDDK